MKCKKCGWVRGSIAVESYGLCGESIGKHRRRVLRFIETLDMTGDTFTVALRNPCDECKKWKNGEGGI